MSNVNTDNLDRLLVTEGKLNFKKDNLSKSLILNDDGIVECYNGSNLLEKYSFSKTSVQKSCKDILDEGYLLESKYNIYVTYGEDGVYSSSLYDSVDTEEQAEDIVAELQAQGLGASYEKVENKNESNEIPSNEEINAQIDNTEQAIEKIDKLQDLKDELMDKMDTLTEEDLNGFPETDFTKNPISLRTLLDIDIKLKMTDEQVQWIEDNIALIEEVQEGMINLLYMVDAGLDDEVISISDYIKKLKKYRDNKNIVGGIKNELE